MKKILTALLQKFRNEAHYEFMIVFRNLIQKFPAIQSILVALWPDFLSFLTKEGELINLMRKSDYTKRIEQADARVDRAVIGMKEAIKSFMHHFDPAMIAAAESLNNRFAAFGRISQKSYEEEIAIVNLLIADLNTPEYSSKIATLGLSPWISELQAAETEFELLIGQRNVETAMKPQGPLREIRRQINALYHKMIDRITAADTMDGAETYKLFIDELNAQIRYFNIHNTPSQTKKDIGAGDSCMVETIEIQYYTGKAITPLPKAFYREGGKQEVELVFGKDFSLTYKNNVEAGTASVTLHGKNEYRGRKTVTFNIIRQ
ncbi:MAG: DUF6261 family protein [Prevotellaceae bacterium]|jgi:hypothetical protein|nr:DUF6261 family protein [Prevotellaceae bacterium]